MLNNEEFFTISLVNGLFYLRTIREFCANIKLSFFENEQAYIDTAQKFSKRCEELGKIYIAHASGNISQAVLDSNILVTEYTLPCELLTEKLFGIDINTDLTKQELELKAGTPTNIPEVDVNAIMSANERALELTKEFSVYLNDIFAKEQKNEIFSYSYPALIKYMIDETDQYHSYLERLIAKQKVDPTAVTDYEYMFITSMKEVASFLRSLVNPTNEVMYIKAESFFSEFDYLLTDYKNTSLSPDNQEMLINKTLKVLTRFIAYIRECIEGLLEAKVYYIVEPIFLDNMLTEANYFKYILELNKNIESGQ